MDKKQTNNQTSNNLIIEIKELKVKEKQNIIIKHIFTE